MDILTQIKPVPQIANQGRSGVFLGISGAPGFCIDSKISGGELAKNAISVLKKRLLAIIGGNLKDEAKTFIRVSISSDIPKEVEKNKNQAYSIEASGNEIVLTAYGEEGLYYAVTTLLQCVYVENNEIYIPEMSVLDWPDLRTRGHFMECCAGDELMLLDDWKTLIDDMSEIKLNQLVVALYGCWNVSGGVRSEHLLIPLEEFPKLRCDVSDYYYSPQKKEWINKVIPTPMAEKDFFGELIAYGKACGVEVLPLWNSYGHNTLVPRMYPEVSAYFDGKQSGYSLCISKKETYDLLFSIYDRIIDKYLAPNGITSFHIGMDEIRDEIAIDPDDLFKKYSPWCECDECKKLSNEEKFLNHAIKLIKHLKSRGMKTVYIYSDMLMRIVDPVHLKEILQAHDLLDVTVIDWWSYANNKEGLMFDTMYPELGMRSVIKPWNSFFTWSMTFDSVPNVYNLAEMAYREGHVEGLQSYASWDKSCDRNHVSMADYSWNFAGTGSISEFRDRYARREFGADFARAKCALELIDKITEEEDSYTKFGDLKKGLKSVGNGTLLQNDLSVNFFKGVAAGKDYPRNFPGETMEKLLGNVEMYKKQLCEIADMSREALCIFEELSVNTDVNRNLAKRFAVEINNYLCLAEDYLALIEIYDATNKDMKHRKEYIAELATKRKKERLMLMSRIESVKEAFLVPSHLHNQSIHMQIFADIEAYANIAKPQEFELDVKNLGKIGSPAFWNLR